MPIPAIPSQPGSVETGTAVLYTRSYSDPQGRAYTGRVTARRLAAPFTSAEIDLSNGRLSVPLEPGRYSITAMLRDADGVRACITDTVLVQEDS